MPVPFIDVPRLRRPHSVPEALGKPSVEPTVLRTDRPEVIDPLCTLVPDSKGLYDSLNNELP